MEFTQYLTLFAAFVLLSICIRSEAVDVQFPLEIKGGAAVRERLKTDLAFIKDAVKNTQVDVNIRSDIDTKIQELSNEINNVPDQLPPNFRTIMPFNNIQSGIFALYSTVLQARDFKSLVAWPYNRWDPLLPLQIPVKSKLALSIEMMRNEYRSDVFNLTNTSEKPITAYIGLKGLPGGNNPEWVSVREVQFTDTYIHYPIAAALPETALTSDGYKITIPAGMTRQIWLEFNSRNIKDGLYSGRITVNAQNSKPQNIPLKVHIYPFDMPDQSSIAIAGWDYNDGPTGAFDARLIDQKAYIKFLRDYGVNTPWAGPIIFKDCEFDNDGHLIKVPDFTQWDTWISKWKGARFYALHLGVVDFLGEHYGTARFDRMVNEWITSVVEHIKKQGISPKQLMLLLVDEPVKPEQIDVTIAWAKAIKAAQPDVVIWSDPSFEDINSVNPAFFEAVDILCPLITRFVDMPQSYRDLFINHQLKKGGLMFYACVNGKHLDPAYYYRAQFWLAIKYKAEGSFYWAFGDEGGAPGSFNAYASPGHMFSPFFIDPQLGIVDGKHMQAIREGAEDFEYFRMLGDRVKELETKGIKTKALESAKRLLTEGPDRIVKEITVSNIFWQNPKSRTEMDKVRIQVLKALMALESEK